MAFSGEMTVERAQLDKATGENIGFDPPHRVYPVMYRGVGMERISIVFDAPELPGVYRLAFRDERKAEPSGYDELIVQERIAASPRD